MSGWSVITAGPSAGKSSTIRELAARGYRTAPEAARVVLDQAISEGWDAAEFRREKNFHKHVETTDSQIMQKMPDDERVFFDRSIADNIAYRRHLGNDDNEEYINRIKQEAEDAFNYVFLLDRIEFKDDEVRVEDEEESAEIHEQIRDVYEELGYNVIEVPVMAVDERATFIENRVQRVAIH